MKVFASAEISEAIFLGFSIFTDSFLFFSDEEIHFSRAPKSKFPSNKNPKEATARLLADDFDVELRSDEDDGDALDLIRPQSVQPRCICCKLTCNIQ